MAEQKQQSRKQSRRQREQEAKVVNTETTNEATDDNVVTAEPVETTTAIDTSEGEDTATVEVGDVIGAVDAEGKVQEVVVKEDSKGDIVLEDTSTGETIETTTEVNEEGVELARGLNTDLVMLDEAPFIPIEESGVVQGGLVDHTDLQGIDGVDLAEAVALGEESVIVNDGFEEGTDEEEHFNAPIVKETPAQQKERIFEEAQQRRREQPWKLIDEYMLVMNPARPTTPQEIKQQHVKLSNQIILLLAEEEDDEVAIKSARRLVGLIRENRKAGSPFHDAAVMRYLAGTTQLNESRRQEYENVLFTLLELAREGSNLVMDWTAFESRCVRTRGEVIAARLRRAFNIRNA